MHRLFGQSFSENLHALMDEQIAEVRKEPKFRRTVEAFNVRMLEVMAEIARKHISAPKMGPRDQGVFGPAADQVEV